MASINKSQEQWQCGPRLFAVTELGDRRGVTDNRAQPSLPRRFRPVCTLHGREGGKREGGRILAGPSAPGTAARGGGIS